MILIGITIIVLGLFLLPLAWRGRISARGQFCRKCKFDLAGLPIEAAGDKCPECGESVSTQSARRTILRRSSCIGLVASLILLLLGSGTLGFGIWGNTASIYAHLPDAIVVQGVKWGSTSALDEAVKRSANSPRFVNGYSDDLVDYALKVQADRSVAWDPRIGEILRIALVGGYLNPDQLNLYAINGWTHTLDLRDKVHAGEKFIQYMLASEGDRIGATGHAVTQFRYGARLIEYGVQGEEPVWRIDPKRRLGGKLYIGGENGSRGWMGSSLWNMDQYTTKIKVGDSIPIYIDLEIRLEDPDIEEPIVSKITRLERSVLVLDPSEPIVRQISNDEQAKHIAEAISVGPLHTMVNPTPPGPNHYNIIMKLSAMIDVIPASFSFKIYLQIGGEEVHIGELVREGPDEDPRGQYVQWGVSPNDSAGLEHALALHAIALEQGTIDVVFKTEPDAALKIPTIDQVVDTTIVFKDVPIKIVETPSEVNNPGWNENQVLGELVTD